MGTTPGGLGPGGVRVGSSAASSSSSSSSSSATPDDSDPGAAVPELKAEVDRMWSEYSDDGGVVIKAKKRGRPPGSKNRPKEVIAAEQKALEKAKKLKEKAKEK